MTAVNIIVGTVKAFILTDSALYPSSGEIVDFGRKCVVSEGARLAVATRGDYRLPSSVADACSDLYDGIDDVVGEGGDSIRSLYDAMVAEAGTVGDAPAQFFFVGWSDREAAPAAALLLYDGRDWTFEKVEGGVAGPLPDATELSRLRMLNAEPGEDYDPDCFDPIAHGIPLVEAQRRMKVAIASGGPKGHVVGGDVLLTTIGEAGIEQTVIHSWPDTVGEPIRPDPFAISIVEGMSRQQRRAAARQAGKAAA